MTAALASTVARVEPALALWGTWTIVERVDDVVEVDGLKLRRAGLTARDEHGRLATGAAAGLHEDAVVRAAYELRERAALLDVLHDAPARLLMRDREGRIVGTAAMDTVFPASDAPTRWQPAKSSGVAIGPDFRAAGDHAALELVERDRVLRSWTGLSPAPERIEMPPGPWAATRSYAWQAYRLAGAPGFGADAEVACVFGFPRTHGAPLLRGFAAAHGLDRARARAARECLQNLAFLWDEAIPADAPQPSPTPIYHLDHYLWPGGHAALHAWLAGEGPAAAATADGARLPDGATRFVDLTPRAAQGRFCVVRAVDERALGLCFGDVPLGVHPPCARGPHPIA